MFISAIFEFLKFRMLMNSKFDVQCLFFYNSYCIFNMTMLKHQLAGSHSKKNAYHWRRNQTSWC